MRGLVHDSDFETGTVQFNCGAQAGRPGTTNKRVHGCPPLQKSVCNLVLALFLKNDAYASGKNKPSHLQEFSSPLGMVGFLSAASG